MIADAILAAGLTALGVFIRVSTANYPSFSKTSAVGPEVLPNLLGDFFIIAAVLILTGILYKLFVKKTAADGVPYGRAELEKLRGFCTATAENKSGVLGAMGILACMLLYALLLERVGFELCTPVFLLCALLLCGERRPARLLLVPLLSTVSIYLIFVFGLHVALPMRFLHF